MRSYERKRMQGYDEDSGKPPRSKKNTKRWCRGKQGREHITEIQRYEKYGMKTQCGPSRWGVEGWACQHVVVCVECGKILKMWGVGYACPDREAKNETVAGTETEVA